MYVLCSDVLNKSMYVIQLNFWYLEHGFLDVLDKFGNPSYFFFHVFHIQSSIIFWPTNNN